MRSNRKRKREKRIMLPPEPGGRCGHIPALLRGQACGHCRLALKGVNFHHSGDSPVSLPITHIARCDLVKRQVFPWHWSPLCLRVQNPEGHVGWHSPTPQEAEAQPRGHQASRATRAQVPAARPLETETHHRDNLIKIQICLRTAMGQNRFSAA